MKNKPFYTLYIFATILFLSICCSCRDLMNDATYLAEQQKISETVKVESLTHKPTDLYYMSNGTVNCMPNGIDLYFTPDGDIPFVEIASFIDFLFGGADFKKVEHDGSVYKITRVLNDSYLTIDFASGEVFYSDFDGFYTKENAVISTDIVVESFLKRKVLVDIKGNNTAFKVNLFDYNLPLKFIEGKGFIPLQVLFALTNPFGAIKIFYNGKDAFMDIEDYYKNPDYCSKIINKKESYSKTFAEYSYEYLCLVLDLYYGRKDYIWKGTNIKNFDTWLETSRFKEKLLSTDINTAEKALATVLLHNICDLHTYYNHMTPFWGLDSNGLLYKKPGVAYGPSDERYYDNLNVLTKKVQNETAFSSSIYVKGTKKNMVNFFIPKQKDTTGKYDTLFFTFNGFAVVPGFESSYADKWKYEKVGERGTADGLEFLVSDDGTGDLVVADTNTIKTVDDFIAAVKGHTENGYGIFFGDYQEDNIVLTTVANYIIKKLNEGGSRPIKNVVFDLSFNGGGMLDGEVFFSSWVLGKTLCAYENKISGSRSAIEYLADITFDGVYDEKDNITDLKRYCITSLDSFSCGNLFPFQAYFDRGVKLLGQTSGGGTCSIFSVTMPSGTSFTTSSPHQLCTFINGSFVDLDAGVTPDVGISQQEFEKVYNRYTFCESYLE